MENFYLRPPLANLEGNILIDHTIIKYVKEFETMLKIKNINMFCCCGGLLQLKCHPMNTILKIFNNEHDNI